MVYQYLVVTILFFPKLVLATIALVYVPFLYPIGMVLEWLMVLLYNKAMYGNFNGKVLDYCFFKTIYNHSYFSVCDDGNLITILTPALFQPLQSFRKCRFFNHLIFYFYFHTNWLTFRLDDMWKYVRHNCAVHSTLADLPARWFCGPSVLVPRIFIYIWGWLRKIDFHLHWTLP